ncbi:MAG: endonuclease Q family protein [Sporomusaceae bacterium]|nr:endonuclease Q family protein [Sporomusaceae bacterium]
MKSYFADLHIHVGCAENGAWVKIPSSRRLTVRNILQEAKNRKGIDLIGIVDCMAPPVLGDLRRLQAEGRLLPRTGGGYCFEGSTTLLTGAEIETVEANGKQSHTLIFLPDLAAMETFAATMAKYIRNIAISTQNAHMPLGSLIDIATAFEALIIPAHIFTPHKGLYGACTRRLTQILSERQISAIAGVELGLSADSTMADRIGELAPFSFMTNSDAHSPDKIAREYNRLLLAEPSYRELALALARKDGRQIEENYGLDPRLGKYHRTLCDACGHVETESKTVLQLCPACGSKKIVRGVFDRIDDIADYNLPRHPAFRNPYFYQIPLAFIPGVGKAAIERLLTVFGTEMAVLHQAAPQALAAVVGEKTAAAILAARSGEARIAAGAGGVYGRMLKM